MIKVKSQDRLFLQDIFEAGRVMKVQHNSKPVPIPGDTAGLKTVSHVLACDNDPTVQRWLKRTGRSKVLIHDIGEAQDACVMNLHDGHSCMRPAAKVALCGWVCHDSSGPQLHCKNGEICLIFVRLLDKPIAPVKSCVAPR